MRTRFLLTLAAAALGATACGNAYEREFHPVSATHSQQRAGGLHERVDRSDPVLASAPDAVVLVDVEPVPLALPSVTLGPVIDGDHWAGPLAIYHSSYEPPYRTAETPRREPREWTPRATVRVRRARGRAAVE